jgi:alkyl hydroperoxide reductase subunit D
MMPVVPPLAPEKAPPSVQALYSRIATASSQGRVSLGYQMMGQVEAFLEDSYENFENYVHGRAAMGSLDAKTRRVLALATSSAMNCVHCVRHHAQAAAEEGFSLQQIAEVLALTATCTVYNTYFKFRELSGDEAFKQFRAGLRVKTFKQISLDPKLVELICIIVSNMNSCFPCTSSHTKKALELGVTHEQIDQAVKVSATMAAFNVFHRTQ